MTEIIINEEWRSIDGYLNYQVSNIGRFRNSKTGVILKPGNRGEYLSITLYKGGKKAQYYTHRLVAQEFLPNPNNKETVDHIDGNKHNNYVSNLRWATRSENQTNTKTKKHSSLYKGVSWVEKRNKFQSTKNDIF